MGKLYFTFLRNSDLWLLRFASSNKRHGRAVLAIRMRQMVYSNNINFCRDLTKYASIMMFAAPNVERFVFYPALSPSLSKGF